MSDSSTTEPRLWLTSMSADPSSENYVEMIEPLLPYLDGIIWALNDVPTDSPVARYLESVKGAGKIIHRPWPRGRHFAPMNDTLWCGPMEEGDLVLYCDLLERPAAEFVSRVKSEIGPMMEEADVGVLFFYGKPFLFRYTETLEYRNTPHWSLQGWSGRAIEWNQIEPNEWLVRLNVRPQKRTDRYHWVKHYASYFVAQPAGSNTCALGLDHFPPGDRNQQFAERETRRLEFRRLMRERGYALTLDGLKQMLAAPLDEKMKGYLKAEKILSDYFNYLNGRQEQLVDSHDPRKALPIE